MNEVVEHNLGSIPEKNLDGVIASWAPELRDEMTADGRLGPDDFRGMHRTALIGVARLRQIQAQAYRGHALNALWGNVSPDMMGKDPTELLAIADPSVEELGKLSVHGKLNQSELA